MAWKDKILFALLMISLTITYIGWYKSTNKCPPKLIEYRYAPRTFKEMQQEPVEVEQVFDALFNKPSPWIGSFGQPIKGTDEFKDQKDIEINKYFISQS